MTRVSTLIVALQPVDHAEELLRALLLQLFHGVRSERQIMERQDFDLSLRGFAGLGIPINGTVIEAWCSMKSFRPRDQFGSVEPPSDASGGRNGQVDFRRTRRSNDSHASTTDPDNRLYRKSPGVGAKLCYMGHVLMETCNGLAVDAETIRVAGFAERLTAVAMLNDVDRPDDSRITLAADRADDTRDFVAKLRDRYVTPHATQNVSGRRSAIDGPATWHLGYGAGFRIRKQIEEVFD